MNDRTWLRQVPYGGYQDGRAAAYNSVPMSPYHPTYAPSYAMPYVGQYADPNRPAPGTPYGYGPLDEMRPIGTTLALAAVAFVLFGGIGAALGYLIHPSTKGAAVGAYLGLAALQGSSAIRRS